jgi:hypothetical protein
MVTQRHDNGDTTATDSSPSAVRYILAANQGDSEPFTMKMEAICSSEMSALIRTTWHHIPENGICEDKRVFMYEE